MPIMIDGHNLIPKLPGLGLRDIDDELQLIQRLQAYYLKRHKPLEVYFDGAPPGQQGARRYGMVAAHFVPLGKTADEAIRQRLRRLGGNARNWTVVSSDHQVQADARAARAQVITSEQFAADMQAAEREAPPQKAGDAPLSPDEVQAWMEEFKRKGKHQG